MPASRARARAASASPRGATANSLKVGAENSTRSPARAQTRLRVLGLREVQLGEPPQAPASEERQVDRRHQQAEALVGADVRGRPLAADVLLPGGEREHEAAPAAGVLGRSHETAGHLAHVAHAGAQESEVRAAEAHRHAEALGLAAGDVGAAVAGRAQQREGERLGGAPRRGARPRPPRPRRAPRGPRCSRGSSAAARSRRRCRASRQGAAEAVVPASLRGISTSSASRPPR